MGIFGQKANGLEKIGAGVERDIRKLISRDVVEARRHLPNNDSGTVVNNLGMLLQRVSLNSVYEIDDLIGKLKMLRQQLQDDGDRMAREIVGYASLSQTAMESTQLLADSLTQRRSDT